MTKVGKEIAEFGTQHLPPASLLHALMQPADPADPGSATCELHEAQQDLTPESFPSLGL